MYGAPTGTFEIKGKVATDNGKDVADAIIRVTRPQFDSGSYSYSESNTDAAGEYSATGHDDGYDKVKVVCLPQDATLEADSTIVDLKHIKDNKHDNTWYRGHAEATVNFKLKNKEGGK